MRKLYAIMLGCAVALSATATPKASVSSMEPLPEGTGRTAHSLPNVDSQWRTDVKAKKSLKMKGMRKADEDYSNPAGLWTFVIYDAYLENGSTFQDYFIYYDAELLNPEKDDKTYLFYPRDDMNFYHFIWEYDAANEEFTFTKSIVGTLDNGNYMSQEPIKENYITNQFEYPDEFTFPYDTKDGMLLFDGDQGIVWAEYRFNGLKYNWIDDLWGGIFDAAGMGVLASEDPGDGGGGGTTSTWLDCGDALFMDGWVLPAFGIDQKEEANQYEVPLQRNQKNPNLFRLVDPYKYGPVASKNTSPTGGYIEFDVTDPDHVVFNYTDTGAGFTCNTMEQPLTWIVCQNALGWYVYMFPEYSVSELVRRLGDGCPYTTFKNGVVSLTSIESEDGTEWDAQFAFQKMPMGGMTWDMIFKNWKGSMDASITFPEGWETVEVGTISSDENYTPEYFNLQGVKVANPEKGQLIIVRKGNKAEKIIF